MATVVSNPSRPTGTGYEGKGPDVDLPSSNVKAEPLRLTVTPNGGKDAEASSVPEVKAVTPAVAPVSDASAPVAVAPPVTAGGDYWPDIKEALGQGTPKANIVEYLKSKGMSDDDADLEIIESVADTVKKARSTGLSNDEVLAIMQGKKYDPEVIEKAMKLSNVDTNWKIKSNDPRIQVEAADDAFALYENIHSKYSSLGTLVQGVFNEEKAIEYAKDIRQLNATISDKMNKQGYDTFTDPKTGKVKINLNGVEEELNSGLMESLFNAKAEMTGSVAGSIIGGTVGAAAGARLGPAGAVAGARIAAGAGAAIGSTVMGAMGGMAGRGTDILINSAKLGEEVERKFLASQMVDAGIADAVIGVVGSVALKGAVAGAKGTADFAVKAWDYALGGNMDGAYRTLLENKHISPDQATEILQNFQNIIEKQPVVDSTNPLVSKTAKPKQLAMAAIVSTQKGAENYVQQMAAKDPKLASAVIKSIDNRSKMLSREIEKVGDPNVGAAVKADLDTYIKDVKDFYGAVKQDGIDAVNGTDFTFDINKLALKPLNDSIAKEISEDPFIQVKFKDYLNKIDRLSADRSFGALIELRQAVNDFKYGKVITNKKDFEAINKVITAIDGQINKGAKEYMPNAKEWAENWKEAKTQYGKMRQLEDNAIFKELEKVGTSGTEDAIQSKLNKYGNKLDVDHLVFNQVVERLSPKTRTKVEAAAIKNLNNKYTYGKDADFQATDFPNLADAVNELNITTPNGKRLVDGINQLAKIFQNDQALSKVSGNLGLERMSGDSIATSIKGKAEAQLTKSIWRVIQELLPTETGRQAAILRQTARVLRNPLNVKEIDQFVKLMPDADKDEIRSLVREYAIQQAKLQARAAQEPEQDFVNFYKQGGLTTTSGKWGKGIYLVDKVQHPRAGATILKQEVNMSRMATFQDISNLLATEVTEKNIHRFPKLNQQLMERGYLGIKGEGRVMLFPETTVGGKAPKFSPIESREWPK